MWLPLFWLEVAHTFRKTVVAERSSNFLIHASIQTQGACAEVSLPQGGCPALLCWGDLIRLEVGLTRLKAMKISKAVPAVSQALSPKAGPCKYYCCGTALCIRSIVKSGGASMEYQKQFWYHFAIWSHQGYRLPMEDLSRFIKNCGFFLLALNVSLSMGHGNTCCMRKTEGPTSTWRKFLASKAEQKNFLHLLNHLQKREYSWELCYLCDWSLVNSRQQNELSRVAEYQIIVGCLD